MSFCTSSRTGPDRPERSLPARSHFALGCSVLAASAGAHQSAAHRRHTQRRRRRSQTRPTAPASCWSQTNRLSARWGLRLAPHAIMNVRHGPARLKGGFAVAHDRASSTLDPHQTAPEGPAIGASRRCGCQARPPSRGTAHEYSRRPHRQGPATGMNSPFTALSAHWKPGGPEMAWRGQGSNPLGSTDGRGTVPRRGAVFSLSLVGPADRCATCGPAPRAAGRAQVNAKTGHALRAAICAFALFVSPSCVIVGAKRAS
jgi:hypothetical protein